MRLFFSGSTRRVPSDQHKVFRRAAVELGVEAARREHTALLYSESKTTIDYHLVQGLRRVAQEKGTRIAVEIHRGIQAQDVYRDVKELEFELVPYRWVDQIAKRLGARAGAIVASDAVIVMGGDNGTRLVGHLAADLRRPVIAVGTFGGAAEEIYQANEACYLQRPEVSRLARALAGDWRPGSASDVLDVCEALADKHSYFLSYAHKDAPFADYVEALLRRENTVVYRDERELPPGDPLWENIQEGIGASDTFLSLWSRRAAKSKWCRRELKAALKGQKERPRPRRVILIQLDDAPPPDELAEVLHLPGHDRLPLARSVEQLLSSEHGRRRSGLPNRA